MERKWWTLLVVCVGTFMLLLDITIVNVALPKIATALALLAQEFHGRERGTAFGIWGAAIAASAAIGPLLGGALTEGLGWQSIFYINVPVGLAAAVLAMTKLAESRDPEGKHIDW